MDWTKPTLTSNYSTQFLPELKDRDLDLAKGLDPAIVTVTNPAVNFIRWNSAARKHEKFNGTAWVALIDYFDIEIKALTGDVTKAAGSSTTVIPAGTITNAMIRDAAAVSVVGRSANSTGDVADIQAGANDTFLQRVGNALTWAGLTIGMIANSLITYAKIQNVSATDRLLGRATAGAGVIEELTCTAAGRNLIDDADAPAQRTTLGLGTLATQSGTFSDKVTKSGDTMTGVLSGAKSTGAMASAPSIPLSFQVISDNGNAAYMTFHHQSAFAAHFGIDIDGKWKVAAWSYGAIAYDLGISHHAAAVNATSGSTIDFTGIRGGTKRIVIAVCDLTASSNIGIRIGDVTGGIATTGYGGGYSFTGSGGITAAMSNTDRAYMIHGAGTVSGVITLQRISNELWAISWAGGAHGSGGVLSGAAKTLASELDRIQIFTAGSFSGGWVRPQIEIQ